MRKFTEAERTALASLNAGQGVDIGVWARAMVDTRHAVQRLGLSDPAVDEAASVASLIARNRRVTDPAQIAAIRDVPASVGTADDLAQVKRTMAILTHAAAQKRLELSITERVLVGAAESLLLGRTPTASPAWEPIARWRAILDSSEPATLASPAVAALVAEHQTRSMQTAMRHLAGVTASADTTLLYQTLATAERGWREAWSAWDLEATSSRNYDLPAAAKAVIFAGRDVRTSSREADPAVHLTVLLETDLAASTVAAAALSRAREGDPHVDRLFNESLSAGRAALVVLGSAGPHSGLGVGASMEAPEPVFRSAPPKRGSPTAAALTPRPTTAPRPVREGIPAQKRDALSWDESVELARRRDAGVVAAAAARGVETARQLLSDASPQELHDLIRDGEQARAEMVASVISAGHWLGNRAPQGMRDDVTQEVFVSLTRAADRWNPDGGRAWGGFAIYAAQMDAHRAIATEASAHPVPLEDQALQHLLFNSGPDIADDVVARHDLRKRVEETVSALPPPQADALWLRLGLDGDQEQRAWPIVAERLGVSTATARRHGDAGLRQLLGDLGHDMSPSAEGRDPEPPSRSTGTIPRRTAWSTQEPTITDDEHDAPRRDRER